MKGVVKASGTRRAALLPSALTWGCHCHKRWSAEGERETFPSDRRQEPLGAALELDREKSEAGRAGAPRPGPAMGREGRGTCQGPPCRLRPETRGGRRTALGGAFRACPGAPCRRGREGRVSLFVTAGVGVDAARWPCSRPGRLRGARPGPWDSKGKSLRSSRSAPGGENSSHEGTGVHVALLTLLRFS